MERFAFSCWLKARRWLPECQRPRRPRVAQFSAPSNPWQPRHRPTAVVPHSSRPCHRCACPLILLTTVPAVYALAPLRRSLRRSAAFTWFIRTTSVSALANDPVVTMHRVRRTIINAILVCWVAVCSSTCRALSVSSPIRAPLRNQRLL